MQNIRNPHDLVAHKFHAMDVLLTTMMTPAQEHEPDELIRMILDMETKTQEAYS